MASEHTLEGHPPLESTLELAGRIALPMICFAGRCLAVLATPPHKSGAEVGFLVKSEQPPRRTARHPASVKHSLGECPKCITLAKTREINKSSSMKIVV